ncbi:MAG: hypothetical protein KKA19_09110 [Candidatus Margulisbacteria bacterium]|nr:hypothetical protein [Candidatus Margulisiibacteriota bacterium]
MNKEQLNQEAVNLVKNLDEHGYFTDLQNIDTEMSQNQDPFNKRFYLSEQDKINEINGELINAYYKLKAELKVYIAVRKAQIRIENEMKKEKTPGNEILESLVQSEIPELYKSVIILEGWVERADSSLKTARNHTYGDKEFPDKEVKKEE